MTKGSGDARTQPLYFLITTAGTDTQSTCYEQHQKAVDILEGRKHASQNVDSAARVRVHARAAVANRAPTDAVQPASAHATRYA